MGKLTEQCLFGEPTESERFLQNGTTWPTDESNMTLNDRIIVLRQRAHGIPVERYVNEIQTRLPEYQVELASSATDERRLVGDATIVTGMRIDEKLLDHADKLRLFACGSAGIGHLPMHALAENGVAVTNASGVHGPNIAEHVIGWMLMFARRLDEGMRRKEQRVWQHFQADELQGSTVTVVGLGAIGEAIVNRLEPFNVSTIGVRYTPEKGGPTDEVIGFDETTLHDAFTRTDYLILACPHTETTDGLIGADAIRWLPADATLINVGRGPIVDTNALVRALRKNELHAVGLDVTDPEPLPPDHPLWEFENVQITPHSSGHTPQYWSRMADILTRNVRRVEQSGSVDNLINQVSLPSS